jgi:hypothetical protein
MTLFRFRELSGSRNGLGASYSPPGSEPVTDWLPAQLAAGQVLSQRSRVGDVMNGPVTNSLCGPSRASFLTGLYSHAHGYRVDSGHMILNVDLAPTLLELLGVGLPGGLHGRSFVPLLEGREIPWRDAFLYEYYEYPAAHCARKNRGVRTARWKLIHFFEQPEEWELYDLESDPDETVNLAGRADQRTRMRQLRETMASLRRELGDSDPPGPPPVAAPCEIPA